MSRTKRGSKAPGFDYSAARPGNERWSMSPSGNSGSKWQKRLTHKAERVQGRADCRDTDAPYSRQELAADIAAEAEGL